MSLRGVWQLTNLTLHYCRIGGSSRGMRDFIESELPKFREANPQLNVKVKQKNGHHPVLYGEFVHGNTKEVTVRNEDIAEIQRQINFLRNQYGMPVVKLKTRNRTKRPSIQGMWTPELNL
mmetsp:Transcript_13435/g.18378  ORF Transcript_13435/g.18378 Transcript_13435/m.18378 type:complete len:120 (-) Transcript_13435:224-583(-)|eukprot:CAMPEP_0196586370 /NCGR_PEP_ID=MMETSP1081-20130531/54024_1 /TAXON_ID=36882 /ORGANISM="Pyramimonas amylifera, Strain CCMP720" /LENGTH=119 /DNA_ID=CAMNT_0041908227 /DNA_START=112 /DNA_END=471 /DNA_ORIENTATION=-